MSEALKLAATPRSERGSTQCRKLRKQGQVPGNIYGHHQDPVPVTAARSALIPVVKSGRRVVDLDFGGKTEKVLLREVQWDAFGDHIQHFDLLRVDADERVTVEVPVVLKGTAAGVVGGGVLDLHLHSLSLECLAIEIPDSIVLRIGHLEKGQAIHVGEIELPANVTCLNAADLVVVQVVEPRAESDAAGADAGPAQPELIKKKVAEEDEK